MAASCIALELPYTPPLDGAALLDHFANRAVPGIERIDPDGTYVRSLALPRGPAVVTLQPCETAGRPCAGGWRSPTRATARPPRRSAGRCSTSTTDPGPVRERLGADPLLGLAVTASPGRRVPGAAEATELCVRTVLGQQISLAGAATAAGRLVARFGAELGPLADGDVTHLFPTPASLAAADPETLAMPRARARSLVGLAAALAGGELVLRRGDEPGGARERLLALPGIGPWSADYIVMRVLGDHDVFLAGDLGVRRALERAGLAGDPRSAASLAERWRPVRSYAMQYLWTM